MNRFLRLFQHVALYLEAPSYLKITLYVTTLYLSEIMQMKFWWSKFSRSNLENVGTLIKFILAIQAQNEKFSQMLVEFYYTFYDLL